MADDWKFVQNLELFKDFSDGDVEFMVTMMDEVVLPPAGLLFKQGAPAASLYIVRSGSVEVFAHEPDGSDHVLATLGPGECLGEMALVRNTTRSAWARAKDSVSLLILKNEKLGTLSEKEPRVWGLIQRNIARILADRLERTDREVSRLVTAIGAPAHAKRGIFARLLGR